MSCDQTGKPSAPAVTAKGEYRQHHRIMGKALQALIEHRKPRVVERADRMKRPHPGCAVQAHVVDPPELCGQHQRGDGLDDQGHLQDSAHEFADISQRERIRLCRDEQALPQAKASTQHHHGQRRHRHDAEAADLDQPHDDDVAKGAPVPRRVDHRQPGDARRRSRGENCRERGRMTSWRRRDRQ